MTPPSVAFAYPADPQISEETDQEGQLELLRRVCTFINERVVSRQKGKLPDSRTIVVRLIVLNALLYPDQCVSLSAYARELRCSRAWLSKVGIAFSQSIGMRASWQRIHARAVYAKRAAAVHAGTWVATDKWERRKIRESKCEKCKKSSGKFTAKSADRQKLPTR